MKEAAPPCGPLLNTSPVQHAHQAWADCGGDGGMKVEVWECRGGAGGVGCLYQSVTGWQLTPVPAVAMGNWPEPDQSWPDMPFCVYLVSPKLTYTRTSIRFVFHPTLLYPSLYLTACSACPWHLTSQSISFTELAWEHCIYPEHTLPVILAEVFLFKLTFKPIPVSLSVVP